MIAQSFHYLPLRPVVCVLVRCRRRRCRPHDPKSCSRRASRRRAWRRRCSRWHVPLALPGTVLRICSSVVGSVCVCLLARLLRRVAPRFSCPCLFVGLVLVRARCVIASGATIDEIASIALLFLLVLSLTAWLSPRHPAQRRPAIVLVPFGTPPDHGALIFLVVKERAADCARCSRNRVAIVAFALNLVLIYFRNFR